MISYPVDVRTPIGRVVVGAAALAIVIVMGVAGYVATGWTLLESVYVTVLPSDAENVFITLTARALNRDIQIIARAELPSTQKKLLRAGADRVVLPAAIGAQRISTLLTRPAAFELMELVTGRQSLDLEIAELALPEACPLCEATLASAEVRKRTGVIVVALKRPDGTMVFNPDSDVTMRRGDTVVLLGRRENVDRFREAFQV